MIIIIIYYYYDDDYCYHYYLMLVIYIYIDRRIYRVVPQSMSWEPHSPTI